MKKRNICFLINNLKDAGGTQRVLSLLTNLLVTNYNVYIFSVLEGKPFFSFHNQVSIYFRNKSNLELFHYLRKNKMDSLILMDSNATLFFGLLRPRKCRLIIWEHLSINFIHNSITSRISRHLSTIFSDTFVFLTNHEVECWERKYPHIKEVVKIYNPIRNIEPNQYSVKEKYNLKSVLAIGNSTKVKGFDTLIKAWNRVEVGSWTLNIVGVHPSEVKTLSSLSKNSKTIKLIGPTKNVDLYYNQSSLYCLSSRHEVLPTTLTEATFYKIPSLFFPCGGGVHEIIPSSVGLVSQDSVTDLANALQRTISNFSFYKELSQSMECVKDTNDFNTKIVELWNKIL